MIWRASSRFKMCACNKKNTRPMVKFKYDDNFHSIFSFIQRLEKWNFVEFNRKSFATNIIVKADNNHEVWSVEIVDIRRERFVWFFFLVSKNMNTSEYCIYYGVFVVVGVEKPIKMKSVCNVYLPRIIFNVVVNHIRIVLYFLIYIVVFSS